MKGKKYTSVFENKIIYENKNRFYIFKKDLNCIKVSTDHGSSTNIKNYEFPVIEKVIKELWTVES